MTNPTNSEDVKGGAGMVFSERDRELIESIISEPASSYLLAGNSIGCGPAGVTALLAAARAQGRKEAEAAQAAAEQARDEAREALVPFAEEFGEGIPRADDFRIFGNLTLGHFRRAAKIINPQNGDA